MDAIDEAMMSPPADLEAEQIETLTLRDALHNVISQCYIVLDRFNERNHSPIVGKPRIGDDDENGTLKPSL